MSADGIEWGVLSPAGIAERERLQQELQKLIDVAHKHGWNGVENSKILSVFFDQALTQGTQEADKTGKPCASALPLRDLTQYTVDGIRHLPPVAERIETGPLQFGDDWPGVFIRGENAAHYVISLAQSVGKIEDPFAQVALSGLQKLLGRAIISPAGKMLQDGMFGQAPTADLKLVKSEPPSAPGADGTNDKSKS